MTGSRYANAALPFRRLHSCVLAYVAAIVITALSCVSGHAETRVALVIGNSDYRNSTKLTNPRNDAADVSAALKRIGFSTIVGLDLDKAGMDDIQIRFARLVRNADVAIFYYSGHAIQYAGTNYLLPVDAQIDDAADLRRLTKVDEIVVDLQQAKELPIMVLDSCRDNPLAESLKRSLGERSAAVQRGLARLNAPQGMIVAYATQAGQTAADGGNARNSPYTTAFLKQIETKEEISKVFRSVSLDVYEKSARKQLPELSLSIFKDFYLGGSPNSSFVAAAAKPAVSSGKVSMPDSDKAGPHIAFPTLSADNNPPPTAGVSSVAKLAAVPQTASGDEPRRIKTFTVIGDKADSTRLSAAKQPTTRSNASTDDTKLFEPQMTTTSRIANADPAQNTPSAGDGGYVVQVASQRSEADAQASYRALQNRFPSVLGSRSAQIKRADLGDKGVYYRAVLGPFSSAEDASVVCGNLKNAGGQCVIQRN